MQPHSKLVFVIDDDQNIADTTAMILQIKGYEAIALYNSESAIAQLDLTTPEIVISDALMPGMNGIELGVLIRERCPGCRVLLLSGQPTAELYSAY